MSGIVGNWPTPAPGKPALLSHGDVITFFHEFGHLMAGTLVSVPYPTLGNLRQDFVEAPSQMLENWMWQPAVLARVSRNVTTGKPLPPDLIQRMIALRQMSAGYGNSFQAFLATYDMRMHSSPTPLDTKATWDSVLTRMAAGRRVHRSISGRELRPFHERLRRGLLRLSLVQGVRAGSCSRASRGTAP